MRVLHRTTHYLAAPRTSEMILVALRKLLARVPARECVLRQRRVVVGSPGWLPAACRVGPGYRRPAHLVPRPDCPGPSPDRLNLGVLRYPLGPRRWFRPRPLLA